VKIDMEIVYKSTSNFSMKYFCMKRLEALSGNLQLVLDPRDSGIRIVVYRYIL
jgi:hypothetical protein